jgi:serine/threonine protein kinase
VGWRPLARGGFATVWEAKQLSLNRLVAVKVDRRTLESDSEQRRFLREAGAAGRMSGHPGIVTVHDAGILTDDRPYLVMALCEGGSLTKWVKGEPRPSQEEVREVGVRIADALAATHARGVLHRDVKPANILIDAYGHSGLADFGLAALPDPGMELSETLEAITPAYAPPEVFHRRPPTEAGDVYSLGATLYAVLSGRPPRWPEDGTPNIVDMFERLEEPIERIPGVNDEFMDALLAAMAHDPADRPTAAEFRDRLSAIQLATPEANGSAVAAQGADSVAAGEASGAASVDDDTDAVAAGEATDEEPPLDTEFTSASPGSPTGGNKPPPEQLADDSRRSRRSSWILAAAVALVLAVSLIVALTNVLPRGSAQTPATAPTTSGPVSPAATPTPTPTAQPTPSASREPGALPDSFVTCSEIGAGVYCTLEPECWTSVRSYADAPRLSDPVSCHEEHLYQTFLAGRLNFIPRRQSTLDAVRVVDRACRVAVVNSMLVNQAERRNDWEVYSLPPQGEDEDFFRCIFGRGLRTTPMALKKP